MSEFVKVREWTCPEHNLAWRHECDCEYCEREWDCDLCAKAEWVDVLNEDGTPKMRELEPMERLFIDGIRADMAAFDRFLKMTSEPMPVLAPEVDE